MAQAPLTAVVSLLVTEAIDGLVGSSAGMREVMGQIRRVAASHATVLISGETGTGKELVARALHDLSPRAKKPFVAVNLGALPETLIEAELFGHQAGAFTGAVSARAGRLESAHGGTLFLDEVGDLPPIAQVKLLRVLQERRFERIGEDAPREADFRLVCATHRDLRSLVDNGKFREDLFHRVNVVQVELPPLRERRDDIPLLAKHFAARFAARDGIQVSLSEEAIAALQTLEFQGNVRELEHTIERAVALSQDGAVISPDMVRPRDRGTRITLMVRDYLVDYGRSLDEILVDVERTIVGETLRRYEGNQSAAAKRLKINRQTLRHRMKKLGLLDE